jgi:hypothetical protein
MTDAISYEAMKNMERRGAQFPKTQSKTFYSLGNIVLKDNTHPKSDNCMN